MHRAVAHAASAPSCTMPRPATVAGRVDDHDQPVAVLRDAAQPVVVGRRGGLDQRLVDGHHLGHRVDDQAHPLAGRLDDHDPPVGAVAAADAEVGGQVADRDDPAAQGDHAAHGPGGAGDVARIGVADDLLHVVDRQAVLLRVQGDDDQPHQPATLKRPTSCWSASAVPASSWADAAICSVEALVCSVDAETCSVVADDCSATAAMSPDASAICWTRPAMSAIVWPICRNASRAWSTTAALSSLRRAPSADHVHRAGRLGLDLGDQPADRRRRHAGSPRPACAPPRRRRRSRAPARRRGRPRWPRSAPAGWSGRRCR